MSDWDIVKQKYVGYGLRITWRAVCPKCDDTTVLFRRGSDVWKCDTCMDEAPKHIQTMLFMLNNIRTVRAGGELLCRVTGIL
jgi:ribosomal protein L37AE/L43A